MSMVAVKTIVIILLLAYIVIVILPLVKEKIVEAKKAVREIKEA